MKRIVIGLGVFLFFVNSISTAATCPDPNTTSLQWGEPPAPWTVTPFSPNSPQGEENTQFVRANILVSGYGRGVSCTYRNSLGEYSIWWLVKTKIPSRMENNWVSTIGGFVCSAGLSDCTFNVAE